MVCCCWLPTPGWTNKLFIRIIKMLPIMCWKSTKAMSAAVFYDFLCWRGFCRCSVFPSPLSLSGLLNQQNIWSGRQWRRARSWLVTCGSADNTLSPSEHHSAVAHSRDDFWWDASQRSLMGSEEAWVGGGRGGGCCTGTDARISHTKQKHLTKINTSKTNRLRENSQSDSMKRLHGNSARRTC